MSKVIKCLEMSNRICINSFFATCGDYYNKVLIYQKKKNIFVTIFFQVSIQKQLNKGFRTIIFLIIMTVLLDLLSN